MATTVLLWQDHGACKGLTDVMFPADGQSVEPAKRVCATCDVVEPCLEFALENNERHGVWGGLSVNERWQLRRARAEERAAVVLEAKRSSCGTRYGRQVHRERGEDVCDACRHAERAYMAKRREIAKAINRNNKAGSSR